MNIREYNQWVIDFYKKRQWHQLDPFIRIGFLTEEVGEVSQAIRSIEIGRDRPDEEQLPLEQRYEHLKEELGDVLDNIIILADKYNITLDEIMTDHRNKLEKRFEEL